MRRIQQTVGPFRSLFNSRDTYRKHYNELKTKWTCCPMQRSFLFDIRSMHRYMVGTADCNAFIQNNKIRLSSQCQTSLQSFDPTRGDLPVCDGRLLRNIADKYIFVVQLYNYTRAWCADGLHPMLIYFNITQIIQCERAIRHGLKNSPEAYSVYDTLSKNLLHVYVQNLNNYRDCSDPRLWDDEEDEDSNSSATTMHRADNCP